MPNFQQRPFSIKVFVPDGDPDGLRLVEKSNWTGVGVVFNRTNYKQLAGRPEFDKTGVYILVGSSEGSSLPTIYVGEGDPVKERLSQHYSKKDFWDWAVFFVTKDGSLNKAHVKHLESRLLDLAKVFEKTETAKKPKNLLQIKAKGIKATGYEGARGFVVCKESQVVKVEAPSIHQYLTTLRKDLLDQGVIVEQGEHYVFTQDQVFNSPSTAAGVVQGRSANGRIDWKTNDDTTLKELQAAMAAEDA